MSKILIPANSADDWKQFLAEPDKQAWLERRFADLQLQGEQALQAQGAAPEQCQSQWLADLRYLGQAYTLNVAYRSLSQMIADFAQLHERRYGYRLDNPIEVVNLRVNVRWPQQGFTLPELARATHDDCNKAELVRVYGEKGAVPVWQREAMPVNDSVPGPAIISDQSATTYVAAGWSVRRDAIGNLILEKLPTTS